MTQTTPEEPTLISPASETDATPYARPEKKSHVPAGIVKLILAGLALLVALLVVVLIFSHKMSLTKSHGQASRRTPAQQQTTATTGVMPADENNTPSAATGSDPDSITPKDILATKTPWKHRNATRKKRRIPPPNRTGRLRAPVAPLCEPQNNSMACRKQSAPSPPSSRRHTTELPPLFNLPAALGLWGRNIKAEPPIARQHAHGMMR